MSEVFLCYSIVIIFSGRLSIARAGCNGPECLADPREVSPLTTGILTAAELQFEYERESILPEYMLRRPNYISYKLTGQMIMKYLEECAQRNPEIDQGTFRSVCDVLRHIDSKKQVLRTGLMQVHFTHDVVRSQRLDTLTTAVAKGSFCVVNIRLLSYLHPQMIDPFVRTLKYPNDDGNIIIGVDEPVILYCPQSRLKFFQKEKLTWKCFKGSMFYNGPIHMNIRNITCDNWQWPDYVYSEPKPFLDKESKQKKFIQMHYANGYLKYFTIVLNYDHLDYKMLYTRSIVPKAIRGSQIIDGNKRIKYMDNPQVRDKFHYLLQYYEEEKLDVVLQQQLQGTKNNYCRRKNPIIIAQLVNPISVVYESLALYTFTTMNYSPQWKSISENNWDTINRHINKLASHYHKDLTVVTGIDEDFQIKNRDDSDTKSLFLNYYLDDSMLIRQIPVKLYFFKIVVEPKGKKGVVFVTVNNPYLKNYPLHELCEEPRFPRLKSKSGCAWDPKFPYHGYSYTCNVEDFFKISKYPIRDEIITNDLNMLQVELEYEIENEF